MKFWKLLSSRVNFIKYFKKTEKDYKFLSIFLCLTIFSVFNAIILSNNLGNLEGKNLNIFLHSFSISIIANFFLLYTLSFFRLLYIAILFLVFLPSFACAFASFKYGIPINYKFMTLLTEADPRLLFDLLRPLDYFYIITSILVISFSLLLVIKKRTQNKTNKRIFNLRFVLFHSIIFVSLFLLLAILYYINYTNVFYLYYYLAVFIVITILISNLISKEKQKLFLKTLLFELSLTTTVFIFYISNTTNLNDDLFSQIIPQAQLNYTKIKYFPLDRAEYFEVFDGMIKKDIEGDFDYKGDDDLTIVLVIGESARGDHFSLNGYERETNPLLKKEKNLVSFSNVFSCGVDTRTAIPCMMTRKEIGNLKENNNFNSIEISKINEKSFISIFKKLGFNTIWLSNHRGFRENENVKIISNEAEYFENLTKIYKEQDDKNLFPSFEKYLKKFKGKKNLFILHEIGSQQMLGYINYPKEFCKFANNCQKKYTGEYYKGNIELYDNTILYTDYILENIINKIKDGNALMLYIGDHGELLGEYNLISHMFYQCKYRGKECKFIQEQHHIPMIWWFSDKFLSKQQNVNNLNELKMQINQNLTQDIIFHSILGCSGIKSDIVKKDLNLCD